MEGGRLECCAVLSVHNSCARLEPRFVFVAARVGVVHLEQTNHYFMV